MILRPSKTIREAGSDGKTSVLRNPNFETWVESEVSTLRNHHNVDLPLAGATAAGSITRLEEVFTGDQILGLRTSAVQKSIPDSSVQGVLIRQGYVSYDPDVDTQDDGRADLFYSVEHNRMTVEFAYAVDTSNYTTINPLDGTVISLPAWAAPCASVLVSFNQKVGGVLQQSIRVTFGLGAGTIDLTQEDIADANRATQLRQIQGAHWRNILNLERYFLDGSAHKFRMVIAIPDGMSVANVALFPAAALSVSDDAPDVPGLTKGRINFLAALGGQMRYTWPAISSNGEKISVVDQEIVAGNEIAVSSDAVAKYVAAQLAPIASSGGQITAALEAMQTEMQAADNQVIRIATAVATSALEVVNHAAIEDVPAADSVAMVAGALHYRDADGDMVPVSADNVATSGPAVSTWIAGLDPEGASEVEAIKTGGEALAAVQAAMEARLVAAEAKLAADADTFALKCEHLTPDIMDCVYEEMLRRGLTVIRPADPEDPAVGVFSHDSGTPVGEGQTNGAADMSGGIYNAMPGQAGALWKANLQAGKSYQINAAVYSPRNTGTFEMQLYRFENDQIAETIVQNRYSQVDDYGFRGESVYPAGSGGFSSSQIDSVSGSYEQSHSARYSFVYTPAQDMTLGFSINSALSAEWGLMQPGIEEVTA